MKVKAKDPRAIYILKKFWTGDLNLRKKRWGESCLYTVNLFVKIQYLPGGCEERRKWQEIRDFGEITYTEENI